MATYKLTLAYDGTDFAGWQVQPGQRTVQGEIQQALERLAGVDVSATASGRTDAGVHALGQVASFAADIRLSDQDFARALQANTPEDVAVRAVERVADGFHAIRDATGKHYQYLIDDQPQPNLFTSRYAWHCRRPLDAEAMAEAAEALVGQYDFVAFEASGSPRATTVRTVRRLAVRRHGGAGQGTQDAARLVIDVEADGFLYNMARNLVGTLHDVGCGRKPVAWPGEVLAGRDRRYAGATAPAHGLYLVAVEYGDAR